MEKALHHDRMTGGVIAIDPALLEVSPKPPLGVKPQILWLEQRNVDLARSIYEYIQNNCYNYPKMCEWIDELREHIDYIYNKGE